MSLYPTTPTTVIRPAAHPATSPQPPKPEQPDSTAPASDALAIAQALDISAKDLKSRWEMTDLMRRGLEEESDRLQTRLEELRRRREELAAQQADITKKHEQSEADLKAAMQEREEAEKHEAAAKQIAAANKKIEERIEPLLAQEAEILKARDDANKALEDADNERKAAASDRIAATAERKQAETIKDQIQVLQTQSWPACLSSDSWASWRTVLQENAQQDAGAALVVAAFHRFCAAQKASDSAEICAALQDLGKRLYVTDDPDLVARIGTAFNESSENKFQLKFALPGQPTMDVWMNYQPGLGSVRQVRNWAVYRPNPAGGLQISSKADVQ